MERLDRLLFRRGLFASREQARRAVMAGIVIVDGALMDKPGTAVDPEASLELRGPREPYASRGGRKLEAALEHFDIDPRAWTCLDIGASTGGFTDCLLARGARRVYAVDVGFGQLDQRLRGDERVVVMERQNARYLEAEALGELCRLAVIDVSFISVLKVLPAVRRAVEPGGWLLPLVKPQFESRRGEVGKGGVIRDDELRRRVIAQVVEGAAAMGLEVAGTYDCPVPGAKGNREAFALLRRPAAA